MNRKEIHDYYENLIKREAAGKAFRFPEFPVRQEQTRNNLRFQIAFAALITAVMTGLLILPIPRPGLNDYRKSTERFNPHSFHTVLAATSCTLSGENIQQRSLP
jgi:hypothetical protein